MDDEMIDVRPGQPLYPNKRGLVRADQNFLRFSPFQSLPAESGLSIHPRA